MGNESTTWEKELMESWCLEVKSGNTKVVSLKLLRVVQQLHLFLSSNATLNLVASYYLSVGRHIVV